jgi:acyl-[acyl-carrier-protein]-phospholipid O-acyltransferase/long-chain-fatty-acid--[acyl-carrier-protein] ligase
MAPDTLASRFIQTAKRRGSSLAMADSTGRELTFGRALVACLLLARAIERPAPNERAIGLLLSAPVGGARAVRDLGVARAGKAP